MIIGMKCTWANLDLANAGDVYSVVAQPLWEESSTAAELLHESLTGHKIPWWTKLSAPLVFKDSLQPYYQLLDKIEASLHLLRRLANG